MKKPFYLATILLLSLSLSTKVSAACTQEEINNFKNIENEYQITYEYDTNKNQTIIKAYNPYPEKYQYRVASDENSNANVIIKWIDNNHYEITANTNSEYSVEVVSRTNTCDDALKTIKFTPPPKGGYHEDELCKGIEEFILCNSNYKEPISREEFESRVNTYKESLKENNESSNDINNNINNNINIDNNEISTDKKNNTIIDYLLNNLTLVIIIIILVILAIINIIIISKRIKKSRYLE